NAKPERGKAIEKLRKMREEGRGVEMTSNPLRLRIKGLEARATDRRSRIIAALMSGGLGQERYWPFVLAAKALWRQIPPRSPDDLVSPAEDIANTLAGWRREVNADSVPTLRKRVRPVGSEGAGPFNEPDAADAPQFGTSVFD